MKSYSSHPSKSVLFLLIFLPSWLWAQGNCTSSQATAILDVNNISAELNGDGTIRSDAFEVPKGSGIYPIFASSVLIGGAVNGRLGGSGNPYRSPDFWSGPLDSLGNPPSDCAPFDRIYSLRPSDIEAYETNGTLVADLEEWPWELGGTRY